MLRRSGARPHFFEEVIRARWPAGELFKSTGKFYHRVCQAAAPIYVEKKREKQRATHREVTVLR